MSDDDTSQQDASGNHPSDSIHELLHPGDNVRPDAKERSEREENAQDAQQEAADLAEQIREEGGHRGPQHL